MSYSSGAEGPATLQDEQATAGGGGTWAATVYLLLLGGIMMVATAPVGVVLAHWRRNRAPAWLRSHYTFQIRTFWLGLLLLAVALGLAMTLLGYFILAAWMVWAVGRCAVGVNDLMQGRAVPNPRGLGFGRG
ncbi:DUF4870 family protein [Alkalilimnicola ehrlichii MLHE-1]|uniref:Transmembrane protein n=1 Tax=Alkalilimnicola ehrlichii (strain ATCC BAA-1101 / DSM 17681 / MLHE-1) TaxID=187272 RepID=Q0A6S4_ALKEH|nr:hypothetical protein [Alkalilimnicola ehrlichii]ABI57463.1 conserved hypothetical protein [Alkalilimnicola ehrlichii MLHE-1]